jgi:hypothetical protein
MLVSMSRSGTTFQQLVNPNSLAALEAELDLDKNRFQELAGTYERAREQLRVLGESIDRQEALVKAVRNALPPDGREPRIGPRADGTGMSKRQIATEVLEGSVRTLFPREVRQIAVQKGWLSADNAAANQLSVAMAKAARAGVLVRDEEGRYSLPARE